MDESLTLFDGDPVADAVEDVAVDDAADETRDKDQGSVLVLTMVFMIVGALIVVPLMDYAMTVMRANHVLSEKTQKIEAAKAGLRLALSDPVSLYEECGQGGPTVPVRLAAPTLTGRTVTSNCYYVNFATAQAANEQRLGLVATLVGAQPPTALKGSTYVSPNPTSPSAWVADTTVASTTGKVWLPNLPVHSLTRRASAGYQMPAGYPTCRVFFPGTYTDPITINGPTYFTSGIYYFENTVTVTSGAAAVVGMGVNQGCSDDQEAAFYAVNAPATHNINGLGATFVFGGNGRLVVSTSTAGLSLVFNQRYVAPGDDGAAPSQGVSIMTVNGNAAGDGPLDVPNTSFVPLSLVGATGALSAAGQEYTPSAFTAATVPAPAPAAPAAVWTPVVSIDATRNYPVTVDVPGYVSMPQGILDVQNPLGKDIRMAGGVLTASFQVVDGRAGNPAVPQSVDIGFIESIVQRTFRIVSVVDNVTSTAVVQVNQNGAYAVNSWEVQ